MKTEAFYLGTLSYWWSLLLRLLEFTGFSYDIYMFKINNRSSKTKWDIYSKLTIKTPRPCQMTLFGCTYKVKLLHIFQTLFYCFCCRLWIYTFGFFYCKWKLSEKTWYALKGIEIWKMSVSTGNPFFYLSNSQISGKSWIGESEHFSSNILKF